MKRIITMLFATLGLSNIAHSADQGTYRLLTEKDIGKVFVAKDLPPHPNFGQYKILRSVNTPGLYAFNTFDVVGGEPVGKFLVSHPAKPIYKEVFLNHVTLEKADVEMKKANARLGEQIRNALKSQDNAHR